MKTPLVSVVITLFNGGRYSRLALESVLRQDYDNLEIILIDNNATQETKNAINPLIKSFPNKIKYLYEGEQGVCSARNLGILSAKGEYIALLDDDDIMYPTRITAQVNYLFLNPNASIVSCWHDVIDEVGNIITRIDAPSYLFWTKLLLKKTERYKKHPFVFAHPSTMMFKKETAIKIGLFDKIFNPVGIDDFDFCFRMYELGPIVMAPIIGLQYRTFDGSWGLEKWSTAGRRALVFWERTSFLFDKIKIHQFYDRPPATHREINIIRSQWCRELGTFLMRFPDKRLQAKYLIKRGLKANPWRLKSWTVYFYSLLPINFFRKKFNICKDEMFPSDCALPNDFDRVWFC